MQTGQTADFCEPPLQRPLGVDQQALPSVKLELVDDLPQQVPGLVQLCTMCHPIQEQAVHAGGLGVVQGGGVDVGHLRDPTGERINFDFGFENALCAGQQLTLVLGRQTPEVGTAES